MEVTIQPRHDATATYKWGVVPLRDNGTVLGHSLWFKTRREAYDWGRQSPYISYAVARREK